MISLAILDIVETSNLILREIRASDASDLSCFMTQARYQKHIVHRLKDEDAVHDFVRRQMAHQGDNRRRVFHLSAEERMSAEVIGDGFLIIDFPVTTTSFAGRSSQQKGARRQPVKPVVHLHLPWCPRLW